MAKKGKKSEVIDEQVSKPGVLDYAKAVWQLLLTWLKNHKKLVVILLVVLVMIGSWLAFAKIQDRSELTNDEIVISVSKQLGIEDDPNPVILDVIDDQKVSQPFLEGSKNGDKVLLYYGAKKSVLYRPSSEQIVREGVYTPPDAKVFIRDGSGGSEAIENIEESISRVSDIKIVSKDKSSRQNYDKIVVVNVTDRYSEKANQIAAELGVSVSRLPNGETIPDADILIIAAKQ